ncbi:hypothetical protein EVAR_8601_1 [Eumeta japonica]|uniref:Uncharacterized protein n=1 Tax=Eumeta variegata TaxID=151549 RepID=A0A4C1XGF6_EUMVA|nr:hypothetical protein EVAR_8601_1 [Eumeta japonica]
MVKLKRYCLLISFTLSVFSLTFLVASAASSYWITATIEKSVASGGSPVTGSLHYGLYGGSLTLRGAGTTRHPLYTTALAWRTIKSKAFGLKSGDCARVCLRNGLNKNPNSVLKVTKCTLPMPLTAYLSDPNAGAVPS